MDIGKGKICLNPNKNTKKLERCLRESEKDLKEFKKLKFEHKKNEEEINEMKAKHDGIVKKFGGEENYEKAVNDFFGKIASGEIKIKVVSDEEMEEMQKSQR